MASDAKQAEGTKPAEQQQGEVKECPICTLMREGGCEQQFHVRGILVAVFLLFFLIFILLISLILLRVAVSCLC